MHQPNDDHKLLRVTPTEVNRKVPSSAPAKTTATTNLRGRLQDATTTRESAAAAAGSPSERMGLEPRDEW